jgi:hypothetical protein
MTHDFLRKRKSPEFGANLRIGNDVDERIVLSKRPSKLLRILRKMRDSEREGFGLSAIL